MGNIREYTYPDVNLGEDIDKHFSYPTNEVAFETNACPKDYNDDIDFNKDLDDVLNQDESDSDRQAPYMILSDVSMVLATNKKS
ncbi:hypothetical protein MRB53_020844 [Persea americana]|uniref:Uncharacterized protein n=1 Tax=Persea americana TaxID=3435 RepID=A0ACC2L218_PERAE|nr:hypothetical protein MRB53_020844 [Persea americana]